jgi:hypothetical protein
MRDNMPPVNRLNFDLLRLLLDNEDCKPPTPSLDSRSTLTDSDDDDDDDGDVNDAVSSL